MGLRHYCAVVADGAVRRRVLQQDAEEVLLLKVDRLGRADVQGDPEGLGPCLQHRDSLRVAVLGDEEPLLPVALDPETHHHRFSCRRRLVQQRRIGERQAGQVSYHRLEGEERLQAPLRDLRLIRRVLGVPAGIF